MATTTWENGFCFEAAPFLKAQCEAVTCGINCGLVFRGTFFSNTFLPFQKRA